MPCGARARDRRGSRPTGGGRSPSSRRSARRRRRASIRSSDRGDLPARSDLAARRRRVRRRRRDGAGLEWILRGARAADSLVVNPHKWLFTPFDLSALYCRRMDVLRAAFSLTPEYLVDGGAAAVRNLMDTGDSARAAIPRAEAVDGAAALRRGRSAGAPGRAHAAGAPVRGVGRRERAIRARCAACHSASSASVRRAATRSTSACSTPSTAAARCSSLTRGSTALHAAARDRQSAHARSARRARVGAAATP